ncbi:hypothetical protein GF342_02050 [Candidatus Woesearchaeota archaeon]|nr:hypothetical protein [Candidatus Woesearchaeota archaeon]
MIHLYLIRHGQSLSNTEEDLIGGRQNDTPLTATGIRQAQLLGDRWKKMGAHFDKVFVSPAKRTLDTARISLKAINRSADLEIRDTLQELTHGQWDRQVRSKIYTPKLLAVINANNWEFTPPGGESQRMVEKRMLSWLQDDIFSLKEGTFAMFGHGMAIKCLLRGIFGFDSTHTYKIVLHNTAITELKFSERGWHLVSVNDTAHLYGHY